MTIQTRRIATQINPSPAPSYTTIVSTLKASDTNRIPGGNRAVSRYRIASMAARFRNA
ncbi:hypothetical protein BDV30DRAFT_219172 [Aspergillus minisclerotigenes]|uniref:Uncharacterized protein n=1 Tax=Aspergillus minisclerotigenes TaxID=656917 RepID=A0A5N6INA5_9EURO|nr:hypothetical protein BDV30DRAFT_219172 [Aspergillus minisclerotigenes]